nr:chaperone protein DnaJ 1, mitochondrial isoform X2 [Tanacetum cinerariifolium]
GKGYREGVCPTCKGFGRLSEDVYGKNKSNFERRCSTCKGSGRVKKEDCSSCEGSGIMEGLKKVKVTVPAGVDSGHIISIPGAGSINKKGVPRTLNLKLKVDEHPIFKKMHSDLYVDSDITFIQPIIGGKVEIPTLNGMIQVEIPKGVFEYGYITNLFKNSKKGYVTILRGKGLPKIGSMMSHGDQYVRFCFDFPEALSDRDRAILTEFLKEESSAKGDWVLSDSDRIILKKLLKEESDTTKRPAHKKWRFHFTINRRFHFTIHPIIKRGVESQQHDHLSLLLDYVILSNMDDRWFWDLNGDGVFRVKDVRILLDEAFLPKMKVPTRWIKSIPIKVNVFAWKLFLDRLPTRSNLARRKVSIPSLACPLCDHAFEDYSHLFFGCFVAKDVQKLICRWWNLDFQSFDSYDGWLSWFKSIHLGCGYGGGVGKIHDDSFCNGDSVEDSSLIELLASMEGAALFDIRDRRVWSLEGSGEFFVASVRMLIDERWLPDVSTKTRWINVVPIEVNIHA